MSSHSSLSIALSRLSCSFDSLVAVPMFSLHYRQYFLCPAWSLSDTLSVPSACQSEQIGTEGCRPRCGHRALPFSPHAVHSSYWWGSRNTTLIRGSLTHWATTSRSQRQLSDKCLSSMPLLVSFTKFSNQSLRCRNLLENCIMQPQSTTTSQQQSWVKTTSNLVATIFGSLRS